ncbi:MAG: hypothetical protein PHE59_04015 [Patescibacteria group bacterium]|nr:hypothetical protein [Patescibacteria group bacterium]MDD5164691.1 hypothetical protein [Patescibacteria group bacterium]MDD5534987.1 hypothetical protein [Patescibacteria group bacterium]
MVEGNRQFEQTRNPKHKSVGLILRQIYEDIRTLKVKTSEQDFDKKYDELREKCINENPGAESMIAAFLGIKDMAEGEKKLVELPRDARWTPEQKKNFQKSMRELTEWQFTITHCVLHAGENKELLGSFWSECDRLNRLFSDNSFFIYKKGVIGQVGVYKMMEHFGLNPEMPPPWEDAFEKTDLKVHFPGDNPNPVQTKYIRGTEKPIFISTDEISHPNIVHYGKEKNIHISNKDIEEMIHLKEKCDARAQREHKEVVGFYLACPDHSFDDLTGKPTEEFLAQIEPEIKKHFPEK